MSRLDDFRAAHPEIRIDPPSGLSEYWSAHRYGMILVVREELDDLLDDLQELEEQL